MGSKERKPRILVVDDKESNVRLLRSTLTSQGYEISAAYDGLQALDAVAQDPPDLVVLDVVMPKMNGFDVARELRARTESRGIPILMLTALRDVKDKIEGLEAGADDFLSKPFQSIELLARVRSLLRIKQLHDELQTKNALLERILMRYISEEIAREILENPDQNLRLGGQSCEVSVLFVDIHGFSRFVEQRAVLQVIQVLNEIFNQLVPIIFDHQGTLDKYLGDAIMAFYGAPIPLANNTEQAVRTACSMRERFTDLRLGNSLMSDLRLGIGISTGEAVVGNVGSERMMDYTVIGNIPNTAKRLQESARADQILIDEYTYQTLSQTIDAREVPPLSLKGISRPVRAYEVLAMKQLEPVAA